MHKPTASQSSLFGSFPAPRRVGGLLSGCVAVVSRHARRNPLLVVLVLLPLALATWVLLNPFMAASYVPDGFTRHWISGGDHLPSPPGAQHGSQNASVLLVSAYFPLNKSKHSWLQYYTWLGNYLSNVRSEVYMFAPHDMEDVLRKLRGPLPFHLNTTFTWAHEIPPLASQQDLWDKQLALDPEARKHNSELYQIWAAKPYFVREAIRNMRAEGREFDYVLWIDAGSMREKHGYAQWPDAARLQSLWTDGSRVTGTDRDDLILIPLERNIPERFSNWQEEDGPLDALHDLNNSEGSLFGGSPRALDWFLDVYFTYLNHYFSKGLFVGKDQSIMNTLFILYPERFITIWNRDPRSPTSPGQSYYGGQGYCGDPWFYYFFVFASAEEQDAMNAIWQSHWRIDFWHGPRLPCQTTRVLAMDDVLRQSFGQTWAPPPHRLELQPVP